MTLPLLLLLALLTQTPAPDTDAPARSFEWHSDAAAWIDTQTPRALAQDDVFIEQLRTVLARDDWPTEAKVDAFALMRRAIGWGFAGTFTVPPGMRYAEYQWFRIETLNQYAHALAPQPELATAVAELADEAHASHPVRAGNALLLATMLDPANAPPRLRAWLDPDHIAASSVPPIFLHNLALAVGLQGDATSRLALLELAPTLQWEESREDAWLCGSYWRWDQPMGDAVAAGLQALDDPTDTSGQAALICMQRQAGPAPLDAMFTPLIAAATDAGQNDRADTLRDWRDGQRIDLPRPPTGGPLRKLWDGFNITVGDQGTTIRFGDHFHDTTD